VAAIGLAVTGRGTKSAATAVAVLAWLLFALVALVNLSVPFTGDQQFFSYGARVLADGGRLYVDFWDVKQPGIYWLYQLAASLPFGMPRSVRVLEAISWAAVAALSIGIIRRATNSAVLAAMAPALVTAVPLAVAPAWHLSQVESFAALPITAVLYLLTGPAIGRARWFGAGVAVGVLVGLKLLLVLVPASIMLVALSSGDGAEVAARRGGASPLSAIVFAAFGFALTAAAICVPFIVQGTIGELIDVSLVYPFTIIAHAAPVPVSRLLRSFAWAAWTTMPLAVMAPWALRCGTAAASSRRVVLMLLAWVVTAVLVIASQRMSWWAYHMMLLKPAIAMLALVAMARIAPIARFLHNGRTIAVASSVIGLFVISAATSTGQIAHKVAFFGMTHAGDARLRWEDALAPGYPRVRIEGAWARTTDTATLCVLGDPALQVSSGKRCTTSVFTWSGAALNAAMWQRMQREMRESPPELVYLATSELQLIRTHAPALLTWLHQHYVVMRSGLGSDRWYRLKS